MSGHQKLRAAGLLAFVASLVLVTAASLADSGMPPPPDTPAGHESLAAEYDREAQALQTKADEHRELADRYAARIPFWEKAKPSIRRLAEHCSELAEAYAHAAKAARDMAASHRAMARDSPAK